MSDQGDETRRQTPYDGASDDRTRPMPRPDDATRRAPRPPDATSVMPPAAGAGVDPVWAGRAEVRAPRPGETVIEEDDWATPPGREPRGRWWTPILVGIIGLILLGLLGWGIYIIVKNSGDDDSPGPVTTSSIAPAPTASVTSATTAPSTAPATEPTTTTATTEPTGATNIPALKGLSLADAKAALTTYGLQSRVKYLPSDSVPGTVIDSDPEEGQAVPPGSTVTLIVAQPGTSSPSASASASTSASATAGN